MANNAKIPDIDNLIAAGINPKTGLPLKAGSSACDLKNNFKRGLRIKDEQTAINRYKWNNLPPDMDGQLLERVLYYKGQGAFFYMEEDETYYFLPYALRGTIDVYGRYLGITPLPFNGTTRSDEKAEQPWIEGLLRKPVYNLEKEFNPNESCVLLSDYSKQISQNVLPRVGLQETILDVMAECFPMARTSLLANSGIRGMVVATQDEAFNVQAAGKAVADCALSGQVYAPITEAPTLTELTGTGTAMKAEEYLLFMQSLNNERLAWYGLDNNGVFEKKAHMLQSEQNMNSGNNNLIYQDGLILRQQFCERVNKVFGLNISVEEVKQEEIPGQEIDDIDVEESQDNEGGEE